MRRTLATITLALLLAPAIRVRAQGGDAAAPAAPAPTVEPRVERAAGDRTMEPWLLAGARIGVVTPQAFNKLTTSFLVEAEAAYQLPFLHRRLGLFLDLGYTQPTARGSRTDPRVLTNGGTVGYTTTVRDFGIAFGAQYRHAFGEWLVPYGGLAIKMHLTDTLVEQTAGTTDLGSNTEQSTRFGVLGRIGLGVHLGPGDLVGELQLEYTPVDHLITGDSNTAHIAIQVGYVLRM
ncbi:MAG TPA: hypothetical protein VGQ83_14480 [Polyangia bacterium]|jgi:hypothetical protein